MENLETQEQKRIKELEIELLSAKESVDYLSLTNQKLGYSIMLMSNFHLSKDEKIQIADVFDSAKDLNQIKEIYKKYEKNYFNKSLNDDEGDFQWSTDFKNNLRHYFAVSLGYDIVSEIGENLSVVANYFTLENKIRNTPDLALRKPMTEKLLSDRENTLIALDKIIDIINSFNTE